MTSQTTIDTTGPADKSPSTPSDQPPAKGLRGHPWFTLITVAVGVMMVALDGTIVAIANPAIAKDLGATFAEVQWITNAYFLALAVSLITAGKLGDRFGHRQTFLIGVVGFAAASGAIGLSDSIAFVVTFRVLQGVFGALLMPAALGLLRATFPAEKLNMAIGIWGMVIGASTAGGPILGGVLVERVNWQSVFFINVPVGILAVALGVVMLLDHRAEKAPRSFDILGIVLLSGAMFCLVWALIKAPEWGWGDGRTWAFIGGSVLLFVGFALWENFVAEPLVPLGLFRSVPLSAGVVLMVLMAIAFMGGLFFVTFYLQNVHGMGPIDAGLHLLPLTGMMIVGSPLAGAMITKAARGSRWPAAWCAWRSPCSACPPWGRTPAASRCPSGSPCSASASPPSWSAPPRSSSATPPWSCPESPAASSRPPCRSAAASVRPSSVVSWPPRSTATCPATGRTPACPNSPRPSSTRLPRPSRSAWRR